ncbi:MAG: hypothetical protein Q9227_002748 [Pyrenula ochraceoflavens]
MPEVACAGVISKFKESHPSFRISFKQTPIPLTTQPDDSEFADVNVLVTFNTLPSSAAACPSMELIHFISAGIDDKLSHPILASSNIPVTTSTGVHGPAISEWFVGTLLAHNLRMCQLYDLQSKQEWGNTMSFFSRKTLHTQRLGVLGYGGIGRQSARLAKALGMDVIAYTASAKTTPESRRLTTYTIPGTGDVDGTLPSQWFSGTDKASLHHFLSQDIDVLLVSVPLSDHTRHLLGREEFDILGKNSRFGPFVSNVARGNVIVQQDLHDALEDGTVKAAAIDVTDPEPLPTESPLWKAKNLTISPHMSGINVDYLQHVMDILSVNLQKRDDESLINVVKRGRGY